MNLGITFLVSLKALKVNALRSSLTMLGIVIGVGAVISMVAIGNGAQDRVVSQIETLGSNLLIVVNASSRKGGARLGAGTKPSLTESDAIALSQQQDVLGAVAPAVRGGSQIVFGNLNWSTAIYGTTEQYFSVRNYALSDGRIFTKEENRRASKVALVGQTVVENIFFEANPIGQLIRVKKIPFRVIGILEDKGQSSFGNDQDDLIIIPLQTAKKRVLGTSARARPDTVHVIWVKAIDSNAMKDAENRIHEVLRARHKIGSGQDDDYKIHNLAEIMDTASESTRIFTLLLGAVASIALLVGGIGIMNIMLVSVTERTREIGLRMAMGARRRDILVQFVVESVTLSLIGGLIGIIVGILAAAIIARIAEWPTLVDPLSLIIAFIFSGTVGVFFGLYPARKAAQLDPIESLRYE